MPTVENKPEILVTINHARAAFHPRMCSPGMRKWFQENDLDWSEFVTRGLPISQLEKFDNHYMKRVLEVARGR